MTKSEEVKRAMGRSFGIAAIFGFREERDYFLDNLSMLLESGSDPLSSLYSIRKELRNPKMSTLVTEMEDDLSGGMTISDAFEKSTLFSTREIALLRIGEESGKVTDTLNFLAKQEEKERQFTAKIRSASLYPVFVLCATFVVGLSVAWFILPKLSLVFDQLHLVLPLPTRILIASGKFLQNWGLIAVPLFFCLMIALSYFIFFFHRTKFIGQILMLHTPGIKRLIQEAEVARFGNMLGTLLRAGVPIIVAFESLTDATTIFAYKRFYTHLGEKVLEGLTFQAAFSSYPESKKLIPPAAQHMICAGADSGRLSNTLISIGERYEAKVEITTQNLSTLLEPALIILVWLGVVTTAFAIITPIYGLLGGIHT